MNALTLRVKTAAELRELLRERLLRRETLTLALRQKKVKNVRELRGVKRDIARIHTVLGNISPSS